MNVGTYHKPVLVEEVIEYLDPQPNKVYVDATFGGGGHTRAILEAQSKCKVIGLDWDMVALETNGLKLQEEFPDRLLLVWGNFSQINRHVKKVGYTKVDGILADFGTSQYQLLQRKGFSFRDDTPLDMRMSPAHQKMTAEIALNTLTQSELGKIFRDLGEVNRYRSLARTIVEERKKKPIKTTKQLVDLVKKAGIMSKKRSIHPATKTFQALRIYVNKELENIQSFLKSSIKLLHPGGRLACITFHSLEDRLVKQFFKQSVIDGFGEILTPRPISPSEEEILKNPSSRSAKLRAFELKK